MSSKYIQTILFLIICMRIIHVFLISGLTEFQYTSSMEAASLGSVEHTFLDTVVNKLGYSNSAAEVYEDSIAQARQEVQNLPKYISQIADVSLQNILHLFLYVPTIFGLYILYFTVYLPHLNIIFHWQAVITDAWHDSSWSA